MLKFAIVLSALVPHQRVPSSAPKTDPKGFSRIRSKDSFMFTRSSGSRTINVARLGAPAYVGRGGMITTSSQRRMRSGFGASSLTCEVDATLRRAASQLLNVEYLMPAYAANWRAVIEPRSNSCISARRCSGLVLIRPRISCSIISSAISKVSVVI